MCHHRPTSIIPIIVINPIGVVLGLFFSLTHSFGIRILKNIPRRYSLQHPWWSTHTLPPLIPSSLRICSRDLAAVWSPRSATCSSILVFSSDLLSSKCGALVVVNTLARFCVSLPSSQAWQIPGRWHKLLGYCRHPGTETMQLRPWLLGTNARWWPSKLASITFPLFGFTGIRTLLRVDYFERQSFHQKLAFNRCANSSPLSFLLVIHFWAWNVYDLFRFAAAWSKFVRLLIQFYHCPLKTKKLNWYVKSAYVPAEGDRRKELIAKQPASF